MLARLKKILQNRNTNRIVITGMSLLVAIVGAVTPIWPTLKSWAPWLKVAVSLLKFLATLVVL